MNKKETIKKQIKKNEIDKILKEQEIKRNIINNIAKDDYKISEYEDLEKLFKKIENLKEFKNWFGTDCPDFNPSCANCKFWNKWNKLKIELFEELFS